MFSGQPPRPNPACGKNPYRGSVPLHRISADVAPEHEVIGGRASFAGVKTDRSAHHRMTFWKGKSLSRHVCFCVRHKFGVGQLSGNFFQFIHQV